LDGLRGKRLEEAPGKQKEIDTLLDALRQKPPEPTKVNKDGG